MLSRWSGRARLGVQSLVGCRIRSRLQSGWEWGVQVVWRVRGKGGMVALEVRS